ncbi:GNAT family N-acetyltransferase [Thiohalobacter thiocyanaticus]|uniref:GNAT family N-acetyltransferase n=1 Tax=Thiohalobacter thiocyanaticus TaxID=585455 RepID=A0A426QE33_9GAMM|nr:GNAT family N-acetyltransferase [Thiohalobacter thiocyanaticus]RRQ19993.1 GNAT family N-acetyltransferase [Thiohalobacter thiocyanaticus]
MTDDAAHETGFLIARADWETDASAIRAIRTAVFVDEQGIDATLEFDGSDTDCVHYLAYAIDGRPIATARMSADGRIGRMAVLPEYRNQGVGSALLLSLIELAGEHKLDEVYVHAQESAASFYHQHGFIATGEPFQEAGIPHISMSRFCETFPTRDVE